MIKQSQTSPQALVIKGFLQSLMVHFEYDILFKSCLISTAAAADSLFYDLSEIQLNNLCQLINAGNFGAAINTIHYHTEFYIKHSNNQ